MAAFDGGEHLHSALEKSKEEEDLKKMSWFDIFGLLNSSGFLVGMSLLDNTTGNTILRSSACVSYHS